jgi:uncharacterized lipoprotein YmbA
MRRTVLVLGLVLSGCSFFSKSKSTVYSIDGIPAAAAPARAITGAPFGIDNVELPPGVDRREIVVRKANQQLDIRSNELWSADLKDLVMHTLAFDLASRIPEGMLILPGEAKPVTMRTIEVTFEDLSAGPDSRVHLDARWKVGTVSHHETIAIDLPSLDSKNVAAGMSQAIAALADRIAAGV